MKTIKILLLIIVIGLLVGCNPQEDPIIDDETTPVEPTPTEPVEPDPTPEPEPFTIDIVGDPMISLLSSDDFVTMSLNEIIIHLDPLHQQTLVGYRLNTWFDSTTQGWVIEGDETVYLAKDLHTMYVIIGEKEGDITTFYDHEEIYLAKVSEGTLSHIVNHPHTITVRVMNPEQAIYYISYSSITGRYDYHTSLRAMQGIINRESPRLMTLTTGNPYFKESDQTWLNVLEDEGYDLIELTSFEEVIYTFKDAFQGLITFKDRFKSYNNWVSGESDFALMMASVTNYAPIPFGTQNTIHTLTGLPIIDSFEVNGKTVNGDISAYLDSRNVLSAYDCYALVFNDFRQAFNTSSYMSLTSEVMDYAASEKMMFFDLKATQSERDNLLSRQINAYFDQNNLYFQVYGWVDHESSALDFISSYGGIIDVVGSGNLSLLSRLSSQVTSFTQKTVDDAVFHPQKKYVTFFASESDTIKVGMAFQHGAWLDPHRGKVKINWGLISDMSVEFPFAYQYFMNTMTDNDYFYSGGGSAIGFVDIDSQMHYQAREAIADANQYYMGIADQQYIDMYNDKYTSTDLFEKSVIGSYLNRSQVDGAYARIHDGNTSIRVETWSGIPVYNRWTNYYPRRASSGHVSWSSLSAVDTKHYVYPNASDYWFIQASLANTSSMIAFDLFRQTNGDGYHVVFENGQIHLQKTIGGITSTLSSRNYSTATRNIKISIDHSTPLDTYTRIKVYVNDLKIFEVYDDEPTLIEGGYGIRSTENTKGVVTTLDGTHYSMAKQIYRQIIQDPNRFIVAYYGFVGTEEYTLAQYRTEPGIGGVISLSPTDFYKIQLLLDLHHPGVYEIVNAREFMQFAAAYQQNNGTLR